MGYYSNLATKFDPYERDHSYTSPETALLLRLDELQNRREILVCKRRIYEDRVYLSADAIDHMLPGDLHSVADVDTAIQMVIQRLARDYDIHIGEDVDDTPGIDEVTHAQISIMDLFMLHRYMASAA